MVEGFGREGDLLTQVGHVDGDIERGVRVAVIQVHDVDATGFGTLTHQVQEQLLPTNGPF